MWCGCRTRVTVCGVWTRVCVHGRGTTCTVCTGCGQAQCVCTVGVDTWTPCYPVRASDNVYCVGVDTCVCGCGHRVCVGVGTRVQMWVWDTKAMCVKVWIHVCCVGCGHVPCVTLGIGHVCVWVWTRAVGVLCGFYRDVGVGVDTPSVCRPMWTRVCCGCGHSRAGSTESYCGHVCVCVGVDTWKCVKNKNEPSDPNKCVCVWVWTRVMCPGCGHVSNVWVIGARVCVWVWTRVCVGVCDTCVSLKNLLGHVVWKCGCGQRCVSCSIVKETAKVTVCWVWIHTDQCVWVWTRVCNVRVTWTRDVCVRVWTRCDNQIAPTCGHVRCV